MANKLPTLPKHNSPTLDQIEAAMKAAKAKKAAAAPGVPTKVLAPAKDPVQIQLEKRAAVEAKAAKKAAKALKAANRKAFHAFGWVLAKIARLARKELNAANAKARKAGVQFRKTDEGKLASKIAKALTRLSPDAQAAFDLAKDLSPEDTKALITALRAVNPAPVKVEAVAPAAQDGDTEALPVAVGA